MTKCKECGQEMSKGEYEVRGILVECSGDIYAEFATNDILTGESIEDCIKDFIHRWVSLDNAISINFTVIKRP